MKKINITKDQKYKYDRYVLEWECRKNSSINGFVDWNISNGIGDPFCIEEWLQRDWLHNF